MIYQGARQGGALRHAPGEMMRKSVGELFQPDQAQVLVDLAPFSASNPRATRPAWTLRRTVNQGKRLGSWKTKPRSALGPLMRSFSTHSSPEVGGSSPATSR